MNRGSNDINERKQISAEEIKNWRNYVETRKNDLTDVIQTIKLIFNDYLGFQDH